MTESKQGNYATRCTIGVMIALMAVFMSMVVMSMGASSRATEAATRAQTELSVHAAKQNGSFESIQSQLSTLRTYHSTLRGELREQRKLLDELLRKSYEGPATP